MCAEAALWSANAGFSQIPFWYVVLGFGTFLQWLNLRATT